MLHFFDIDSWYARDKWGRTPLHYAYLNGFKLPKYLVNILPLQLTDVDGMEDIDAMQKPNAAVHAAVLDFMKRLVVAVGEEDHRFEGILHQVGSSFEGTRVEDGKKCNFNIEFEFDFNIELVNLSSICDVATSPECPDGFVHLSLIHI